MKRTGTKDNESGERRGEGKGGEFNWRRGRGEERGSRGRKCVLKIRIIPDTLGNGPL